MNLAQRREPPDQRGWWARISGDEIAWLLVETFDDGTPPSVWVPLQDEFVPVTKLHRPLVRWAGPIEIDKSETMIAGPWQRRDFPGHDKKFCDWIRCRSDGSVVALNRLVYIDGRPRWYWETPNAGRYHDKGATGCEDADEQLLAEGWTLPDRTLPTDEDLDDK